MADREDFHWDEKIPLEGDLTKEQEKQRSQIIRTIFQARYDRRPKDYDLNDFQETDIEIHKRYKGGSLWFMIYEMNGLFVMEWQTGRPINEASRWLSQDLVFDLLADDHLSSLGLSSDELAREVMAKWSPWSSYKLSGSPLTPAMLLLGRALKGFSHKKKYFAFGTNVNLDWKNQEMLLSQRPHGEISFFNRKYVKKVRNIDLEELVWRGEDRVPHYCYDVRLPLTVVKLLGDEGKVLLDLGKEKRALQKEIREQGLTSLNYKLFPDSDGEWQTIIRYTLETGNYEVYATMDRASVRGKDLSSDFQSAKEAFFRKLYLKVSTNQSRVRQGEVPIYPSPLWDPVPDQVIRGRFIEVDGQPYSNFSEDEQGYYLYSSDKASQKEGYKKHVHRESVVTYRNYKTGEEERKDVETITYRKYLPSEGISQKYRIGTYAIFDGRSFSIYNWNNDARTLTLWTDDYAFLEKHDLSEGAQAVDNQYGHIYYQSAPISYDALSLVQVKVKEKLSKPKVTANPKESRSKTAVVKQQKKPPKKATLHQQEQSSKSVAGFSSLEAFLTYRKGIFLYMLALLLSVVIYIGITIYAHRRGVLSLARPHGGFYIYPSALLALNGSARRLRVVDKERPDWIKTSFWKAKLSPNWWAGFSVFNLFMVFILSLSFTHYAHKPIPEKPQEIDWELRNEILNDPTYEIRSKLPNLEDFEDSQLDSSESPEELKEEPVLD